MVSSPTKNMQWVNGKTYMTTWSKGVNDGVVMLDLELARLSVDGLTLIAQNSASHIHFHMYKR